MSRLSSISDSTGTLSAYKYLGLGRIVEEDDEGARLIYLGEANGIENNVTGLDRFGRVIRQLWQDGTYLNMIDEYTYTYDRAGNVTDRLNNMDLVLTDHYVYDGLDRLIEWDEGWPLVQQKVWSLDSLGNNISTTNGGTYDAANEETSIAGSNVTPAYDAAGNMIVLSSGGTAKYDAWNRLAEVDVLNSEEEITSTYAYDGAGRRVRETVETRYIQHPMVSLDQHDDYYVGQQVVETRDGTSNEVQYQNIWSPRYIDAMILRDTYSGGNLVLADRVFYLSDANYNVTGLMKYNSDYGEWDIVERYAYTPYGAVTYFDHYWDEAEDQTGSAYGNTTLYAGRTLDLSTGLYYNRARYYDATLERFVNRDPLQADANLYRYCYNDPSGQSVSSGEDSTASVFAPDMWVYKKAVTPCGGFEWDVIWVIPPAYKGKEGVLIQKVQTHSKVTDCSGNNLLDSDDQQLDAKPFYEAWYFSKDGKVNPSLEPFPEAPRDMYINDKWIGGDYGQCSWGKISITAEIKGFVNVSHLPGSFKSGNLGGVPASRELPSTWDMPAGWDKGTGLTRTLTVSWDCCNNIHTTLSTSP